MQHDKFFKRSKGGLDAHNNRARQARSDLGASSSKAWKTLQAAFTRTRFYIDTVSWLQNRVKIDAVCKCLHGPVFARKLKSWWYKRALQYVLNQPLWIEWCKFRAKIVTVFKSMQFRSLHDRWNRIVLKTLHFWQRFQIDAFSIGVL